LLINPSSRTDVGPVLRSEILVLIVNSVVVHQFVKLGEVKERDHWVAMMFHVVVGIPQELTNNGVGLDGASVSKHVDFVHFTISVFSISNVVDGTVANDDGNNPPKEDGLKALLGLSKDSKDCNVAEELNSCSLCEVTDMNRSINIRLHAPASSRVINWNTVGCTEDSHGTASKGVKDVKESLEVAIATVHDTTKLGILKLFTRKETRKLRILVYIVGVRVMLLVHLSQERVVTSLEYQLKVQVNRNER
jgi:hypothetical protein